MVLKLNIERFLQIRFSFEKILAHLFFFFFCAQILSPYISGRTLYLEFFVALFNPFFLIWVYKQKISKRFVWFFFGIFLMLLFLDIQMFVKMTFTIFSVVFLFYAHERKLFFGKTYIVVSILFAIAQFTFLFINPDLARLIGPNAISQMIWGAHATESLTNFYTVFFIPRVSGLSREAGFFASFLISMMFFFYLDKRRNSNTTNSLVVFLLIIGFILSFSKMSLFIIPLILIERVRKIIDQIPYLLVLLLFVVSMFFVWYGHISYLVDPENETFLHRFGGYVLMPSLNVFDLIFGTKNFHNLDSPIVTALNSMGYDNFAGLSGFMIEKGVLFTFFFFLMLMFFGVTTTGLLVLLFLTINVQLDTNQNFVVMAYFICLKFFSGPHYSIFNTSERL